MTDAISLITASPPVEFQDPWFTPRDTYDLQLKNAINELVAQWKSKASIATSAVPALQAIAGLVSPITGLYVEPTVDAQPALMTLFSKYAEVIIDLDLALKNVSNMDVSDFPIQRIEVAGNGRLRSLAAGGRIVVSGKTMYMEPIVGALPVKSGRRVTVHDASRYSVGDWIHIGSGTEFPYADGTNYSGAMRRIIGVSTNNNTITLNESTSEFLPLQRGRRVSRYMKTAGTYPAGTPVPVKNWNNLTVFATGAPIRTDSTTLYTLINAYDRTMKQDNLTVSARTDSGAVLTSAVTNKALSSNVATLTLANASSYAAGRLVTVSGVDATFNGTYVISASTSTTISYAVTAADVASTAATGTAVSTDENLAVGTSTLTFDQAVTVTEDDYLIPRSFYATGNPDYIGGPWIVKVVPRRNFELCVEGIVSGPGYFSASYQNPLDYTPSGFVSYYHTEGAILSGNGWIGDNPVTAISLSNAIGTIIRDILVKRIWDTGTDPGASGGAGYGITENGSCYGTQYQGVRFEQCRHGRTTNVGPSMYVRWNATVPEFPITALSSGVANMGGVGNEEHARLYMCSATSCTNHGFDSHRNGYDDRYIECRTADCGGGFQTRNDATVWSMCEVDGVNYGQGFAVSSSMIVSPILYNPTVKGLYSGGAQVAGYSMNHAAKIYNGKFLGRQAGSPAVDAVVVSSLSSYGGQVELFGFEVQDCRNAFYTEGGVIKVYDVVLKGGISTLLSESGASAQAGDNTVMLKGEKSPIREIGQTNYVRPELASISTGGYSVNTQWGYPIWLPDGLVKSLGVDVSTSAAGASVVIAIFKLGFTSTPTNVVLASTTNIDCSSGGTKEQVLATPFDTQGGGLYWLGIRFEGAGISPTRANMIMSRGAGSMSDAITGYGRVLNKLTSAGTWSSWTSGTSSSSSAAPVIGVGMTHR